MDKNANLQTQIIERDVQKVNERLDRHLEIYAQNGKELAALKQSVDSLEKTITKESSSNSKDQSNQWGEIRKNNHDISEIKVVLSGLVSKITVFASFGSFIAASLGGRAVDFLINSISG